MSEKDYPLKIQIQNARRVLADARAAEDKADDAMLACPYGDERLRNESIDAGHRRAEAEEDLENLVGEAMRAKKPEELVQK